MNAVYMSLEGEAVRGRWEACHNEVCHASPIIAHMADASFSSYLVCAISRLLRVMVCQVSSQY